MDPDSVLLYLDETHIRSYHVLRSTWSEVGRQRQAPTFGHHATYRCLARSTSTMAKRCFIKRPLPMPRRSWIS
ncbi:Uncharacterised protein [[Flavobacterium] thermophilum]|nr:Uncharacterised protein [[Flavobacterium] thermophilum]